MSVYLTRLMNWVSLRSSVHQRLYLKAPAPSHGLLPHRSSNQILQKDSDGLNNYIQKMFYYKTHHILSRSYARNSQDLSICKYCSLEKDECKLKSPKKKSLAVNNLPSPFHGFPLSSCNAVALSHFRFLHASSSLQDSKVGETLEAIKETIKKEQEQQTKQQPPPSPSQQSPSSLGLPEIDVTNIMTSTLSSTPITKAIPPTVGPPTSSAASSDAQTSLTQVFVPMMPSDAKIRLVPSSESSILPKSPAKPPLTTRIINELKHYYHGFRLLFIDVRVAIRLIWSVLNGKTLMRRERKQLVRTTADLFRLVPFLVFIIVPFAEFLLPVVLKFFPGMLPSTFQEEDKEQDKKRKRLKMKLEMAKFLQDTIEETALQRKDARGESVHEFVHFMSKIRTSGVQTSNEEILKFSKLFEDSLTLDNLTNAQLRAMCQILDITPVGPSYILRFQLEMKLRELEADDKMIQHEGLDGMAIWELQDACRQRGMRSFGVPEERLKSQLLQWLDLHLNMKIPTSLLLLSRTLYFPEHISTEDQLKATILALPETLTEEAKVKILEKTGDRVDNKSKLEVIKQEEMLIKMEKMEVEGVKEKEASAKVVQPPISKPGQEVLPDKAASLDHIVAKEEIHTKDLEKLEQVLEMVVDSKSKLTAEVEELKNLKEEFTEYKENIDQLKGVIESSATMGETPLVGLEESKAAKRLTKKVEKMIAKLDSTVETLAAETQKKKQPTVEIVDDQAVLNKQKLKDFMDVSGGRLGDNVPDLSAKEMLEKQETMVTVSELIGALESLKKDPESQSKYEMITKILDEDQDGLISYQEASRFMELLGGENLKIGPEKMADIVKTLRKERQVSEAKKLQKQQQQLQQQQQQLYHEPQIPDPTGKQGDSSAQPIEQTSAASQQNVQSHELPKEQNSQQPPQLSAQQQTLDQKPKP